MPKGMIDQVISSAVEPSICSAATPRRRRYRTANTTIAAKMATLTIARQNDQENEERVYVPGRRSRLVQAKVEKFRT